MLEYHFPPLSLLMSTEESSHYQSLDESKRIFDKVNNKFIALGIPARVVDHKSNPFSTILQVQMNGITVDAISEYRKDLEYATASMVEFQEKEDGFFIAVKRNNRPVVSLREVMESTRYKSSTSCLTIAAGSDLFGGGFIIDLKKDTNLLVAGVTGAGKSVFLADIILSILYKARPDEVRLFLIDPKGVDLTLFDGIPHMRDPVATDHKSAMNIFRWLKNETVNRLSMLNRSGDNDIDRYNRRTEKKLQHIVLVVDEFSELILRQREIEKEMKKADPAGFRVTDTLEKMIGVIAFASERTGIHLIMATQRPSSAVITSDIKRTIETRTSFTVVDKKESRIIIRMTGAERLLGAGDMIYISPEKPDGIHGRSAFVSDEEIDRVVRFMRNERGIG